MQVRYQAALRPEIYENIITGPMADTLLAQDIEQALDFPTQEPGIELGESPRFHLHRGFIQPGSRAADGEPLLV